MVLVGMVARRAVVRFPTTTRFLDWLPCLETGIFLLSIEHAKVEPKVSVACRSSHFRLLFCVCSHPVPSAILSRWLAAWRAESKSEPHGLARGLFD